MPKKKSTRVPARERITQVVETFFLTEPLLFAAWTMHDVVETADVSTIRVGRGRIEFNPEFITSLRREELRDVVAFESMRILLGHPYARRQDLAELSYQASNLTVQEYLRTALPFERPRDRFGGEEYNHQYHEFYYRELVARAQTQPPEPENPSDDDQDSLSDAVSDPQQLTRSSGDSGASDQGEDQMGADQLDNSSNASSAHGSADESNQRELTQPSTLEAYADAASVGHENTLEWAEDELLQDEINVAVREAAETSGWGSLVGQAREHLLATLRPRLDYRRVLQHFRQSVLSVSRSLTRMKPSRRYGLQQMGSRYEFTTKLLFAVDVSGSMSKRDLDVGFSLVRQFFRHGVESIDVVWFDEKIRNDQPLSLRRARASYDVIGRGGTNFQPVIDFIDDHRHYDGCILYTDGFAPVPEKPKNARTQLLWLFKDEDTYERMNTDLKTLGKAAWVGGGIRN